MELLCNGRRLDLSRPQVMGILNITPDSFSDGGRFLGRDAALRQAQQMATEGAAILDVGGESSRPGAAPVSLQQELDRVIPVVEALAAELPLPLSIDTTKPAVMRAAVAAGAGMINDIMALQQPGAVAAAAELAVPVVLMHMQGAPQTMQQQPHYSDVVSEVGTFLRDRLAQCRAAGIAASALLIDPGFGFGKRPVDNWQLLQQLDQLAAIGAPLLVGISRKSMLGHLLDQPVDQRLYGGVAATALAVWQGARLIRSHDVAATCDAVAVATAARTAGSDNMRREMTV